MAHEDISIDNITPTTKFDIDYDLKPWGSDRNNHIQEIVEKLNEIAGKLVTLNNTHLANVISGLADHISTGGHPASTISLAGAIFDGKNAEEMLVIITNILAANLIIPEIEVGEITITNPIRGGLYTVKTEVNLDDTDKKNFALFPGSFAKVNYTFYEENKTTIVTEIVREIYNFEENGSVVTGSCFATYPQEAEYVRINIVFHYPPRRGPSILTYPSSGDDPIQLEEQLIIPIHQMRKIINAISIKPVKQTVEGVSVITDFTIASRI